MKKLIDSLQAAYAWFTPARRKRAYDAGIVVLAVAAAFDVVRPGDVEVLTNVLGMVLLGLARANVPVEDDI